MTAMKPAAEIGCAFCGAYVVVDDAAMAQGISWQCDCPPPLTDADVAEIVRVALWARERAREIQSNARALAEEAEQPYRRLMAQEGDRLRAWLAGKEQRSCLTLEGRIGTRSYPARLTAEQRQEGALVADTALLRWAREHCPEAIIETVALDAIPPALCRAADPETGEEIGKPPPGLLYTPERSSLYVESARGRRKEAEGE